MKRIRNRYILGFIFYFVVTVSPVAFADHLLNQWKKTVGEKGVGLETAYMGEFFANTKGGIKRDQTYQSNINFALTIDTAKAALWENGKVFAYLLSNHGDEKLSASIVGDKQTASNIEGPRTTRLYELWYEHLFLNDTLAVLGGIHDYTSEFAVSDYGSLYVHSSLGTPADISIGARPSTFPLAAPGVRFQLTPNEQWELRLGVYDGNPGNPEDDEHMPRSDFDREGGAFIGTELAFHFDQENLPGTIKLGQWTNTGKFNDVVEVDDEGNVIQRYGNYGGYFIVDKILYKEEEDQGLGTFLQISGAPDHINEFDFYVGGGFNYTGLLPSRDSDELGVAIAHASVSNKLVDAGGRNKAETALEATYKAQINANLTIQPDLQYIFNPGTTQTLEDAFVAGLRFELAL